MAGIAMSKRASLAFALVLAGMATVALFAYVRSVEQRALGGDTREVLVAKDKIAEGTTAGAAMQKGLLALAKLPRRAVVDGAVLTVEDIAGSVAATDILAGEQIVKARFVAPSRARAGFAIPADHQAMSVEVAPPTGVSGYVQAGDHVSILAKAAAGGEDSRVAYLVQDVEVLAVGQRASQDAKSGIAQGTQSKVVLTLALTAIEAEKVGYAVMEGEIWFTLLPQGQQPQGTPGRVGANLFS